MKYNFNIVLIYINIIYLYIIDSKNCFAKLKSKIKIEILIHFLVFNYDFLLQNRNPFFHFCILVLKFILEIGFVKLKKVIVDKLMIVCYTTSTINKEGIVLTRNEFKKEAAEAIIDYLEDGYTGYLCELHNEVFNYGYYETSKYIAADWFSDYEEGVFNVIEEIKNYEQSNFGEVTTDFSDASKVLNMFWYIIGEEVMDELMEGSADCDELWNEELTEEENKLVLKIFKERMEELF